MERILIWYKLTYELALTWNVKHRKKCWLSVYAHRFERYSKKILFAVYSRVLTSFNVPFFFGANFWISLQFLFYGLFLFFSVSPQCEWRVGLSKLPHTVDLREPNQLIGGFIRKKSNSSRKKKIRWKRTVCLFVCQ